MATASVLPDEMETGSIILWSGSIVAIPSGWHLCDGTVGTPDLRDKFLVGAGSTYAVGATGGSLTHQHTVAVDAHNHEIPGGDDIAAGAGYEDMTVNDAPAGSTNAVDHKPPYYALAYIMKL